MALGRFRRCLALPFLPGACHQRAFRPFHRLQTFEGPPVLPSGRSQPQQGSPTPIIPPDCRHPSPGFDVFRTEQSLASRLSEQPLMAECGVEPRCPILTPSSPSRAHTGTHRHMHTQAHLQAHTGTCAGTCMLSSAQAVQLALLPAEL